MSSGLAKWGQAVIGVGIPVETMLRAITLVAFVLMAAAVFGLLAWAV